MKLPIQYALSWPDRWPVAFDQLDLVKAGPLTFYEPDTKVFRAWPWPLPPGNREAPCPVPSTPPMKWRWHPS